MIPECSEAQRKAMVSDVADETAPPGPLLDEIALLQDVFDDLRRRMPEPYDSTPSSCS